MKAYQTQTEINKAKQSGTITQITRNAKHGKRGTSFVFVDQTGRIIRTSTHERVAAIVTPTGVLSWHDSLSAAHTACSAAKKRLQTPHLVVMEIRDGEQVQVEARKVALQIALDKNPTDVVDSVQKDGEANTGQTKETGTMGYAHSADSTPGNDTAEGLVINFTEGVARVAEVKDDKGEITTAAVAATGGTCRCGCGADVKAGSKFLPGHDAKLKGKLSRAALAGVTVTLNGVEQTPAEAAYTDEYDYRSTVERAVELATEKAKSSEVKEAEKAAKKAAREAEAEAKKAAKQAEKDAKAQAKVAEAEAEALAKASSGTVDPAKADEVEAPPAQTEAPRAARRGR